MGKGKSLKKKGKKGKKGKNLKKSEKGAGKRNGSKKKNSATKNKKDAKGKKRNNGAKKNKKNGKGKKRENGVKKDGKNQKEPEKKSRKNKADGAGKNKGKKNKKKARKAAKKADKKEKKKMKNNRRVNVGRQDSCMDEACIINAVNYMKQLKLAVKNFGKQYNRIITNAKQSKGKSGKNDEFAPYLIKLREAGGGNASNLTCHGSHTNQGATNLKTLYDNLATCETIINATCHTDNMPDVNMTFLDGCKATMDNFTAKTDEAIKASGADACLIWQSAELAEMSSMLKGCNLKSLETEHTAAKKACTGNFSYCRQEEDKVSQVVSACSL